MHDLWTEVDGNVCVIHSEFQNRKRYGGMHDIKKELASISAAYITCFKTVNGMEACTTDKPVARL